MQEQPLDLTMDNTPHDLSRRGNRNQPADLTLGRDEDRTAADDGEMQMYAPLDLSRRQNDAQSVDLRQGSDEERVDADDDGIQNY